MSPLASPLSEESEEIDLGLCGRCAHYYVTWNAPKPHGCRATGLECASTPCAVVHEISGTPCRAFFSRPAGRR